jgi:hypothetical protein
VYHIENKADSYHIIKEIIINTEKSPELIFEVGYCKNLTCNAYEQKELGYCCKHHLSQFDYGSHSMCNNNILKQQHII